MSKKYYCPECGRECFQSPLYPLGILVCWDMGHWIGERKFCLTNEQVKAKFEEYQLPIATSSEYAWW